MRRLSDLYDRDLEISPGPSDDQATHHNSPSSEANHQDNHRGEGETRDERVQELGPENEEPEFSFTRASYHDDNQYHDISSVKACVAAEKGTADKGTISARTRFSSQTPSAAKSTKNNRLSAASTLVDNEVRLDNLVKYKTGSNDHVVKAHSYNCRNGLFQDVACPACVVVKYDALGIQYLPKHEDPCTSLKDLEKFPGLEPVSCEESKPRWRHGPRCNEPGSGRCKNVNDNQYLQSSE